MIHEKKPKAKNLVTLSLKTCAAPEREPGGSQPAGEPHRPHAAAGAPAPVTAAHAQPHS